MKKVIISTLFFVLLCISSKNAIAATDQELWNSIDLMKGPSDHITYEQLIGKSFANIDIPSYVKEGSEYFYNKLNSNEKQLYRQLYSNLKKGILYINYDKLALKNIDIDTNRVNNAIERDHPELFWINFTPSVDEEALGRRFYKNMTFDNPDLYKYYGSGASLRVIGYSCKYKKPTDITSRISHIKGVMSNIDSQIKIKNTDSQFMKVHKIATWTNRILYNDVNLSSSGNMYYDAHNIYGGLCLNKGVCETYALVTEWLCQKNGIECTVRMGINKNEKTGHMWNVIKINNKWYQLDLTGSASGGSYDIIKNNSYDKTINKLKMYSNMPHDIFANIVENTQNSVDICNVSYYNIYGDRIYEEYNFINAYVKELSQVEFSSNNVTGWHTSLSGNEIIYPGSVLKVKNLSLYEHPTTIDLSIKDSRAGSTIYLKRSGLDTIEFLFELKMNGKVITDPETLSKVKINITNTNGFDSNVKFNGLHVAEIKSRSGNRVNIVAGKSGIAKVDLDYNGHKSSNSIEVVVPGDVNKDGYITISDAAIITDIVKNNALTDKPDCRKLADVNGDGRVNVSDASIICMMITGKVEYDNSFLQY